MHGFLVVVGINIVIEKMCTRRRKEEGLYPSSISILKIKGVEGMNQSINQLPIIYQVPFQQLIYFRYGNVIVKTVI